MGDLNRNPVYENKSQSIYITPPESGELKLLLHFFENDNPHTFIKTSRQILFCLKLMF